MSFTGFFVASYHYPDMKQVILPFGMGIYFMGLAIIAELKFGGRK
jgi:hypothetical protein